VAVVSTYLNFPRETAPAVEFYREVFGSEFVTQPMRFRDLPAGDGAPSIAEEDLDLIINVQLPITGGHVLMGSDAPPSLGFTCTRGNASHISLHVDSRQEADRLFTALAEGGKVGMPMAEQFWGDYWGSLTDRFGVQWMVSHSSRQ
jgi:PhnB protein